MFTWKRSTVALAAVTAAALALAGCSGSTTPSGTSTTGGTLTLGAFVTPASFEAANANWANDAPFEQAVYDTLLKANPDGSIAPDLATAWKYNSDHTKLTLTLRTDVKFSDGTKLTAAGVAQNLLRFKKGTSAGASYLAHLSNAAAIDSSHVLLTLSTPDPAMLTYLSQDAGLQESPKAFNNANVKTVPVGSGPYLMDTKHTVAGSTYVFVKNKHYWNPADQHYAKVVINVYANSTALLNAIQGGQVNATTTADNTIVPQAIAAGFKANPLELNWQGMILGDRAGTLTPALKDVRVRQAINYAFDRPALLKAMSTGYGTVTEQIFPPSSPSFDKSLDSTYSYDPAKAKALLAQAGYPNGFALTMPSTAVLGESNYAIVKQQLAAIGIQVTYVDLQPNDYVGAIISGKYSMEVMALQQDPTDWQLASFSIAPTANFNGFHTEDPKVDNWLKTLQFGTASQAASAGKALNAYVVKQAWFAPWFRPGLNFLTDAHTSVKVQVGNAYPYLWNITPKN